MNKFDYESGKEFKDFLTVSEKIKNSMSSSDTFGISIIIISCLLILTPFVVSGFDTSGFKHISMNPIEIDKTPADSIPITDTIIIDGKPHSITVKLIVEKETKSVNTF